MAQSCSSLAAGGHLAKPALAPGLLEAVDEVGVDLLETWHLGRVHKQ
ncbi:hypothetical protein [Streptomyces sp. NPDC048248]